MIMVEGNGTSDTMFERGFQNLFLVATIASDYTRSGIEALAAAGARTAVIAYEDTSFPDSAKELGFEPGGMLISVGPSNPKLIAELGTDADGVLGPTQWEPSMDYAGPYFGRASDYADYYEILWGEEPVYKAARATAAALALHLAIEAAGTTDTVREALRTLSVDTFFGPISFDERGVNTSRPMAMVQVQDGGIFVVAPGAVASAELQYPLGPGRDSTSGG